MLYLILELCRTDCWVILFADSLALRGFEFEIKQDRCLPETNKNYTNIMCFIISLLL